ncbi:TIGR04282 family arsenosugar biosynthesis glycosyltransferase [Piscinibacter sakaiensis]|uniref:TIGR04282 family arsenosugar biosynthesis glycosyltransferase n=1 Tax=Piscinibacter sakaiensis TaxID=1547922 RepID=UPI003AAE7361
MSDALRPPPTTVVVFAKAPLPGFAKTRLIPALGAEGAAALAARLLRFAVTEALAAQLGAVEVWAAPDGQHPAFAELAQRGGITLRAQGEGDLGERMARAFAFHADRSTAAQAPPVLLIGTDAPGLDRHYLRQAAAALAGHDAVFGPALDGGYTLVGLRRPAPQLFDAMTWSTSAVMAETRLRLQRLGLRHAELPPLTDIDEPADLERLPPGWLTGLPPD